MEANYPTLKRPRRKLCYLPNKKSTCNQWVKTLGLDDIDKMFDNLEESSHEEEDEDQLSPTPLLQISETIQNEREPSPVSQQEGQPTENIPNGQMGPEKDVLPPAARSPSLKLDMDLEDPFKAHGPIKTSSPIVENMMVEVVEEVDNEKDRVVSPLLFACEDGEREDATKEASPTRKPQLNGHITEQSDDSEFESPPCKVTLSKSKVSKAEDSSKESQPIKENASKKPQTAVLERKRKALREKSTEPPVLAATLEPKTLVPKKKSESAQRQPSAETSTRVGSDTSTFLQRLRDATQPKPSCSRKFLSSVKPPPPPPEPEDDFLILEDDSPLWFTIPRKSATSKRQSRSSSNNTESSTEKVPKDETAETDQKKRESEQERQTGNQKTKQKKVKEKKNEVIEPGNDMDELCSHADPPTGDLMEQEAPNKKERLKEAASKESNEAEEQPKDRASRETDEEKPTLRKAKKTKKSSDTKSTESVSGGKENTKTSRAKSLKGGRKATKGSGTVKETVDEEAVRRQRSEEAEDLTSPDKEVMNFEAETEKQDKQNRPPAVSAGSLSKDDQISGRRKRWQPRQWWLSCPQSTEEPEVPDNQLTQREWKKSNKEPVAAVSSSAKNNKGSNLKRRKQTETVLPSSQKTNKAKEKKTSKINTKRKPRGNTPNKIKVSGEGFDEEEQEGLDQDLDPAPSSPLVFAQRDLSHNSDDQIFQRVYHHLPKDKLPITSVPVSPRGSTEQLRTAEPEKRRRRPVSNWWMVNGQSEDVESSSSQTWEQEPKPRKGRKKQPQLIRSPGLGTPKHGNTVVSSKPLGGAPVPSLKETPVSAPKTVKRSLATFKDIFTSATATPAEVSNKDTSQSKRRKVTARPAVEVTVTDCTTPSHKDCEVILSMDAAETNSVLNHDAPQDSKSENMLKSLRSGPSSMIELEEYEENDDLILPSNKSEAGLCMSDLCAPPLKPLVLQPKDKANLTEWFKSLWSTNSDNGPEISPDHFDWYFYQGRAIGFLVDLNCGSFCSGKILLGSYMKKPLWVDHSATTVFNISTSSVSVTIDGNESCLCPGKSFVVPCGHAYSIKNITAQPAVLYFTRMLAESSD